MKTEGCKMAKFPIMSREIKKYFNTPNNMKKVKCSPPALTKSNSKAVWITDATIIKRFYNISDPKSLKCQYKEFYRLTDNSVMYSNFTSPIKFGEKLVVKTEFIKVICEHENMTDPYINYHSFAVVKPSVEQRIQKILRNATAVKWNVMLLGIDSVSKMNFERLMKKTHATLTKFSNVYEYFGFSKVADNTFPNLIPLLTGFSADELLEVCAMANQTFDKCRFIWNNFKTSGFRTLFAEDSAW